MFIEVTVVHEYRILFLTYIVSYWNNSDVDQVVGVHVDLNT